MEPLDRAFFARPTPTVARALLGQHIVAPAPGTEPVAVRVVETEAYLGPEDPGSHATRGRHTQAGALWGEPGTAYVYISYGLHQMLNVVAHEPDGVGAVLFRAAEPVAGVPVMQARRSGRPVPELLDGPGKLAQALGLTREEHHGLDLTEPPVYLAEGPGVSPEAIAVTGRIGLSRGGDRLLRFVDETSDRPSRPLRSREGRFHKR